MIIGAVTTAAAAASAALLKAAPTSARVIGPSSLSLTLDFTGPAAFRLGQSFDDYFLVGAPGTPVPAELGSVDGRTVVSVTPVPLAACRGLPALFAGSSTPGRWCLRLAGLRAGTTVQGSVASRDAQLTLQVSARDPVVPLPLLATFLGLLAGALVLLLTQGRLAPWFGRWLLYARLDRNSNALRSGRAAITGIDRNKIRSLTAANRRRLDRDASFVKAALEVLEFGPAQLASAREKLREAAESAGRRLPLTGSPLLSRAVGEAAIRGASWSDFFDDAGKRRAKLPPEEELDRLTFALGLLEDLDDLSRQVSQEGVDHSIIANRLDALRTEVGQAGGATDVGRALQFAEEGIQQLRKDIRYLAAASLSIYLQRPAPAFSRPSAQAGVERRAAWAGFGGRVLSVVVLLLGLAGLALTGHLKVILIAGIVIAGIAAVFLVVWGAVKAAPFLKRAAIWTYQRVFLRLARGIAVRFQVWRYALLLNVVSVAVVAVLTLAGVASALSTVYAGRAAFGTWSDYAALASAAAGVSVVAAVFGVLADRFRGRRLRQPAAYGSRAQQLSCPPTW